ncbi:MAG: GNAT family N-acetyltransferase [Hyphomonas sp.]|nr:GNAT family N-acetyltransferase [Hyphomonas sp.]
MNTSSLIVKPLERQDHAAWRALWTGYLDFYKSKVSEAVYATTFDRLFADGPYEPRCLLAWDGGTAVGLVHFMAHRHCWRVEDVCYLQDLFASPEARGKGVGRALIEAVYREADARGLGAVYWLTAGDNATARQLYDRVAKNTGFIKYQH